MEFRKLHKQDSPKILNLAQELNPTIPAAVLAERLNEMWDYPTYCCFGCLQDDQLIGISSGWITTRFYSGKQLEIDNVIVSSKNQSKGIGAMFIKFLEQWAQQQNCLTLELNTYVGNSRSHKFYFGQGYKILGFHFQKNLGS